VNLMLLSVTWRVLHINHKVMVGRAGLRGGVAVVALRAPGAVALGRGGGTPRRGAGEPEVRVVQLGQTPALQLAGQNRLTNKFTRLASTSSAAALVIGRRRVTCLLSASSRSCWTRRSVLCRHSDLSADTRSTAILSRARI